MTGPVEVVCLGILVADVLARPVDAVPAWGSLALVDEIALRGGGCALNMSSALVKLSAPAAAVGKVGAFEGVGGIETTLALADRIDPG